MWYLLTILIAVSGIVEINGVCNECTPHGFACASERDFYICSNGVVNRDVRMTCPVGTICTELSMICATNDDSTSSVQQSCRNECDVCGTGRTFACTSRTTFALCSANALTSVVGTCPGDLVCDTTGTTICVARCGVTTYTCDRDFPEISTPNPTPTPTPTRRPTTPPTPSPTPSPTTPPTPIPTPSPTTPPTPTPTLPLTPTPTPTQTPTPTTTPPPIQTPAPETPAQVCASRNTAGRFAYGNDNSCINYVNCRYQGSVLVAVANTCPTGTFFNQNTQLCETTRPAGCV